MLVKERERTWRTKRTLFLPFMLRRSEPISERHGKGEKYLLPTRSVAAREPPCSRTAPPARTTANHQPPGLAAPEHQAEMRRGLTWDNRQRFHRDPSLGQRSSVSL